MDDYSVFADLLATFRTMSDGVKVLLIYMPCVFGLGAMALYLYHQRHKNKEIERQADAQALIGTVSPADDRLWLEKTWTQPEHHPTLDILRRMDDILAQEVRYDKTKR